jgi:hypothetical protein
VAVDGVLDDIEVHHEFADLLFAAFDLLVFLRFVTQRPATERMFGAGQETLAPLLHLRHGQPRATRRFGNGNLAA